MVSCDEIVALLQRHQRLALADHDARGLRLANQPGVEHVPAGDAQNRIPAEGARPPVVHQPHLADRDVVRHEVQSHAPEDLLAQMGHRAPAQLGPRELGAVEEQDPGSPGAVGLHQIQRGRGPGRPGADHHHVRVQLRGASGTALSGRRRGELGCTRPGSPRRAQQREERMGEPELQALPVEGLRRREGGGLLQWPDRTPGRGPSAVLENAVDCPARGLVGALHGRDVGVGPHVVGGEEEVLDPGAGLRPTPPRARGVDQQRLVVDDRPIGPVLDAVGEVPVHQVSVLEPVLARGRDVTLQLGPDLLHDLLPGALPRRLANEDAGLGPVRDADREHARGAAVAEGAEDARCPELGLGDAGERPGRVGEDEVSGREPEVTAKEELQAGHPPAAEAGQLGELRVGRGQPLVHQRRHPLRRERADVVVGAHHLAAREPRAGDPPLLALQRRDRGAKPKIHAPLAQVEEPGVQPGVVSRAVEHPGHLRPGLEVVEEQLQPDGHGGAGAGEPRAHRDQGLHGNLAEEATEVGVPLIEVVVVPVGHVLALGETTLGAAGHEQHRPAQELAGVGVRDSHPGVPAGRLEPPEVLERAREVGDEVEPGAVGLEHPRPIGGHQVVEDSLGVGPERDALHRVRQVLVERGEEAKPMFARQAPPTPRLRARHEDAAGLAPLDGFRLVDRHPEAALDQLVGRAHAAHPAPEHTHARRPAPRPHDIPAGDVVGLHRCSSGAVSTLPAGDTAAAMPRASGGTEGAAHSRLRDWRATCAGGAVASRATGSWPQEAHMHATRWTTLLPDARAREVSHAAAALYLGDCADAGGDLHPAGRAPGAPPTLPGPSRGVGGGAFAAGGAGPGGSFGLQGTPRLRSMYSRMRRRTICDGVTSSSAQSCLEDRLLARVDQDGESSGAILDWHQTSGLTLQMIIQWALSSMPPLVLLLG